MAGVEATTGKERQQQKASTDLVPFELFEQEASANAAAWEDVAAIAGEKSDVDEVCKAFLKRVHPDVCKEKSYSAGDVAAMLNAVRAAAR